MPAIALSLTNVNKAAQLALQYDKPIRFSLNTASKMSTDWNTSSFCFKKWHLAGDSSLHIKIQWNTTEISCCSKICSLLTQKIHKTCSIPDLKKLHLTFDDQGSSDLHLSIRSWRGCVSRHMLLCTFPVLLSHPSNLFTYECTAHLSTRSWIRIDLGKPKSHFLAAAATAEQHQPHVVMWVGFTT